MLLHGALAVAGVGRASHALSRGAVPLHMAGGLVLLVLALRLGRSGAPAPRARGGGAYLTTLAVGLTKPLTIVYFTAAMAAYGLMAVAVVRERVTSVSARLNPPHVPPQASEELPSPAERLTDEMPALVHCRRCWADHPLPAVQTLSAHRSSEGVVTYFRCPTGHADFFTTR